MTLSELSKEYRESGELCRKRVEELKRELKSETLGETQRLLLRRRIYILSGMARQTIATANYLKKYYGDGKSELQNQ